MQVNQLLYKNQRSAFSRIVLPILVLLSFVWLNLYSTLTGLNSVSLDIGVYGSLATYLGVSVFFAGLLDYIVFEILFFIYRLVLGFSIYSFMIPKNVLLDKFRIWYLVRNLLLGVIFNLRFLYPFFGTYICIFELILNMLLVIVLYFDLSKNYVEPLVGQFVFKTLAWPVFIYEIYIVIRLMAGVL